MVKRLLDPLEKGLAFAWNFYPKVFVWIKSTFSLGTAFSALLCDDVTFGFCQTFLCRSAHFLDFESVERGHRLVVNWENAGEGNGNRLQYSCLANPMDGGAWWAAVHGVAKSWTRLRDFTSLHFHFQLESFLIIFPINPFFIKIFLSFCCFPLKKF